MANRAHRFIQLDNEENSKLRAIEQNVHMKAKVRLRAQVLRLSNPSTKIVESRYGGRAHL